MTPLLFLPLFFCILASWFDLRLRRIPDVLNASFFAIAIALGLALGTDMVLFGAFAGLAFLFAFALYKLGAWAGGDAKFFACLMSFYPLFKSADAFAVIAVFLAAVLLFVPFLILSKRKEIMAEKRLLPLVAKRAFYSAIAAAVVAAGWGIALNVRNVLGLGSVFAVSFLAAFAISAWPLAQKLLRKGVRVEDLREGMIPAETVFADKGRAVTVEGSLFDEARGIVFGQRQTRGRKVADAFSARGLTRWEIVELKKLKGVRVLQIREAAAFAPLVSLGFFAVAVFA